MADAITLNALTLNPSIMEARLTLETGVAVSTTDQGGKTSVFLTPDHGNRLCLYDGTAWKMYALTADVTLALGTLTNAKHYDVFAFDSSGNVALEFSAAWSSDSARTDALAFQDGILCKSGALTRRYLGTMRTTSTTTTGDTVADRYLFNYYNQVPRVGSMEDATTHTINNQATREYAGGVPRIRINFVIGAVRQAVLQSISVPMGYGATASNALAYTNLNGTTGARCQVSLGASTNGTNATMAVSDIWMPTLGLNYVTISEQEAASQTCTVGGTAVNRAVIWG